MPIDSPVAYLFSAQVPLEHLGRISGFHPQDNAPARRSRAARYSFSGSCGTWVLDRLSIESTSELNRIFGSPLVFVRVGVAPQVAGCDSGPKMVCRTTGKLGSSGISTAGFWYRIAGCVRAKLVPDTPRRTTQTAAGDRHPQPLTAAPPPASDCPRAIGRPILR